MSICVFYLTKKSEYCKVEVIRNHRGDMTCERGCKDACRLVDGLPSSAS